MKPRTGTRMGQKRLAVRETWQPSGRREPPIRRRRIAFHNPAQLLTDAARILVPECRPVRVSLYIADKPSLRIDFGHDNDGVSTSVHISLVPGDTAVLASYLFAGGNVRTAMIFSDLHAYGGDDDGGGELTLPQSRESTPGRPGFPATRH
jgi:hypothetical protein